VTDILQLPVVAHIPVPYDDEIREQTQVAKAISAHDTRMSASHPLRHAVQNLVRAVADHRAIISASPHTEKEHEKENLTATTEPEATSRNGAHYLLTDLTVFLSHEPCIMCSMALLHSRVKEIFYLIPMEKTGGCGSIACLPKLSGVNHRFGIGRWKPDMDQRRKLEDLDIGEECDA
jgi:tRNA-specific adenosine deaminase 3